MPELVEFVKARLATVTGRTRRRRARQAEVQRIAQRMPMFVFVDLPGGGYVVKRSDETSAEAIAQYLERRSPWARA